MLDLFQNAIDNYDRDYPERYVAQGVRNSVVRAFQTGCFKLEWDVLRIEDAGARSIALFKSRDWVRGFLKEVRVAPSAISPDACLQNARDVLAGRIEPLVHHDPSEPVISSAHGASVPEPEMPGPDPEPVSEPEPLSEDTVEALGDGTVSQGEVESRQKEQEQARSRIEEHEISRAGERADSYVQQGHLTTDEGEALRQLSAIDDRLARGEIDADEASHLRN